MIKQERVIFIDALRSYAILAMVMGHTILTTLQDNFRDLNSSLYGNLYHLSGTTAPLFFFSSGLIFSYLLFNSKEGFNLSRFKKGIYRSLYLIGIGFIIQFNLNDIYCNSLDQRSLLSFLKYSHVLQSIGLCIISISIIYLLSKGNRIIFSIITIIIFNAAFILHPFLYHNFSNIELNLYSLFLSHNYAKFPLVPWIGFALCGSFFGILISSFKKFNSPIYSILIIIIGYLLKNNSWSILHYIYKLFIIESKDIINLNVFTYIRLGEVFILFGLFSLLTKYIRFPEWIIIPGRETLMIYIVHNILIFGSIFGIGLQSYFYHSLNPIETLLSVIAIEIFLILFSNVLYHNRERFVFLRFFK